VSLAAAGAFDGRDGGAGQAPLATARPIRRGRTLPHWPKRLAAALRSRCRERFAIHGDQASTCRLFRNPIITAPVPAMDLANAKGFLSVGLGLSGGHGKCDLSLSPVSSLPCGHDWDAAARRGPAAARPGWQPPSRHGCRPWQKGNLAAAEPAAGVTAWPCRVPGRREAHASAARRLGPHLSACNRGHVALRLAASLARRCGFARARLAATQKWPRPMEMTV
jgi:hypothetical protein